MKNDESAQALRAARAFEVYVRYVWPLHRRFVKHRLARRCVRCAASQKMVPLDAQGVCQLCREHAGTKPVASAPRDTDSPAKLGEILREHEGRGRRRYDALVLFSGGKDSTYLIRRVQTDFPRLRLLAYTIDNGFMSPIAKDNVQRLVGQLNVDHVMVRPNHTLHVKLFRYCITHLNAHGGYGTVDFSDGELMLDTARNLAAEGKIPLILCGYSRYQVQNGLGIHTFESPRERELADRTETAGLALGDIFTPEEMSYWWQGSKWPREDVARLLFPLYAWDLEEDFIKEQVGFWGLLNDKQTSPIVTNHALIPVLGVVDVHRLGYSSFESELCRMVREGKADRRAWQHVFELLEHTAKTGMFLKSTVHEGLARLGLTPKDVGVQFP